ncbi:helix-turn-helix domain-containing protein [Aeromicrobium endophyticum]|uniref:helix-turn-helix domain-containing protein n=1 Tax=Aeromicrobium endophyticum TaxID=2292704 RepID=UPI0018F4D485|nr:helix-turn-helix domain-containing protein [Aeromicrobium endophyticum]
MAENLRSDLSVAALADRAGLSPRHFARAFATEIGIGPRRYVDLVRLEATQRMLTETVDGVNRIAHVCGYGTPEAMRRALVRELRLSPTQYRETFRRKGVVSRRSS